MSTKVKERSFWSSTSGVVTGVAGTLTGVVGLITAAAQLGWIGSDGGGDPAGVKTEGSTVAGAPAPGAPGGNTSRSGSGSGSGSGAGASTPTLVIDPARVTFESLGSRKETVTVQNSGTVAATVQAPTIEGANPTQFSATAPTCTRAPLGPGRTCEVEVTFAPSKSGSYKATLVVQVAGARAQEVSLSGSALL